MSSCYSSLSHLLNSVVDDRLESLLLIFILTSSMSSCQAQDDIRDELVLFLIYNSSGGSKKEEARCDFMLYSSDLLVNDSVSCCAMKSISVFWCDLGLLLFFLLIQPNTRLFSWKQRGITFPTMKLKMVYELQQQPQM